MHNKFEETILKHNLITKDDSVVLAISGGSDSVCLLLMMIEYYGDKYKERIICAHYNHMIRGEESDNDEAFVCKLCEFYEVKCICGRGNVPEIATKEAIGMEECARKMRYSFLEEVSNQYGNIKIAVAHNRNDNVETIIGNIARGTTINGLKGISYSRNKIIRPLMDFTKDEINEICSRYGITPVIDSTNSDNEYKRNNIRNNIIPFLKENLSTQIEEKLLALSESAILDNDYIEQEACKAYDKCCNISTYIADNNVICEKVVLNIKEFLKYHTAIQYRIIRKCLANVKEANKYIFPEYVNIERKTVIRLLEGIKQNITGKSFDAQSKVSCEISYGNAIFFTRQAKKQSDYYQCSIDILSIDNIEVNELINNKNDNTEYFDYDKLKKINHEEPVVISRSMNTGDIFHPFGSLGNKKLRKFFIDEKIDANCRKTMQLFCMNNIVLWIPKIKRRSDIAKIDETTQNVLILRVN